MRSNSLIKRNALSAAITAALLASGQVALAQEQTGDAEGDFMMEEIIVTATRRDQSVQDIPFNISAITGSYIEEAGLLDATELMREVPGVTIADGGARAAETNAQVMIRGINIDPASTDRTYLSAPTVSIYVGDTPMYANFILRDIERVEVLRGPQATLYGSGSLGGTVRYITNKPSTEGIEGEVKADYSQTEGSDGDNYNIDAMFNLPITDRLAVRGHVGKVDNDGVIDYINAYRTNSHGEALIADGDNCIDPREASDELVLNNGACYKNEEDADDVRVAFSRLDEIDNSLEAYFADELDPGTGSFRYILENSQYWIGAWLHDNLPADALQRLGLEYVEGDQPESSFCAVRYTGSLEQINTALLTCGLNAVCFKES